MAGEEMKSNKEKEMLYSVCNYLLIHLYHKNGMKYSLHSRYSLIAGNEQNKLGSKLCCDAM